MIGAVPQGPGWKWFNKIIGGMQAGWARPRAQEQRELQIRGPFLYGEGGENGQPAAPVVSGPVVTPAAAPAPETQPDIGNVVLIAVAAWIIFS